MNPLPYAENILFLFQYTLSMIFRRKWILSLTSKYSLSCSETILFYDIFDIIESYHLFRKHLLSLFRLCSLLWHFDLGESSHPCRKVPFPCFLIRFSYDISGKWILSLIPRYLLSPFRAFFCSILLRYRWIIPFILRYLFFRYLGFLYNCMDSMMFRYKWALFKLS